MTKPLALFAATLSFFTCLQVFGASRDTWAMWQGDAGHTGYLPDTLLIGQRRFAWSEQAMPTAITGLAVSADSVFTTDSVKYQPNGNTVAHLGAQILATGSPRWTVNFAPGVTIGSPAYADGRIFVVENVYVDFMTPGNRFLSAFDAATGAPLFRMPLALPGTMYDSPTVADGHVFFESQVSTGVFSTNPSYSFGSAAESDGHQEWQSANTQGDGDMPTFSGGRLYGFATQLNVIEAGSGVSDGAIANPGDSSNYGSGRAPVVAGSMAYAVQGGKVIAIDLVAQQVAWTKDVNAFGQMATDGLYVFYLSAGALTLRDASNGALRWGWEAPVGPIGATGLTDNFIVTKTHVIVTDGVTTYFINRTTHRPDGNYSVGGLIALAADRLVIADPQGIVTVFDLPSDELFANAFE